MQNSENYGYARRCASRGYSYRDAQKYRISSKKIAALEASSLELKIFLWDLRCIPYLERSLPIGAQFCINQYYCFQHIDIAASCKRNDQRSIGIAIIVRVSVVNY